MVDFPGKIDGDHRVSGNPTTPARPSYLKPSRTFPPDGVPDGPTGCPGRVARVPRPANPTEALPEGRQSRSKSTPPAQLSQSSRLLSACVPSARCSGLMQSRLWQRWRTTRWREAHTGRGVLSGGSGSSARMPPARVPSAGSRLRRRSGSSPRSPA